MWWRIFIPSWRFFDSVGPPPRLLALEGGEWVEVCPRPRVRWYTLFFNPAGNRYHAVCNLLERLLAETANEIPAAEWVSYRLAEDLVRGWARTRHLESCEFKIQLGDEDVLRSRVAP